MHIVCHCVTVSLGNLEEAIVCCSDNLFLRSRDRAKNPRYRKSRNE
jgi:hypothetical protein